MKTFASRTAEQLAEAEVDRRYPPHPSTTGWSYEDAAHYEGVREGLLEGLSECTFQSAAPNPILVRFREFIEGETLADESWAAQWTSAIDALTAFGGWLSWDDQNHTFHVLTQATTEQAQHAHVVLSRLASLAESV